jgi:alkylation response protein AidB-like acyl-CoA dehydrogenase
MGRIGYHRPAIPQEPRVTEYFGAGMRLYLDHLVDWEGLLGLRRGSGVDVPAEVAAYQTLLETAAKLAASFERNARENWHLEAELTPDGGAQSPGHIRAAYDQLRAAGLVSLGVGEEYGGYGLPALIVGMCLQMISRADPSLMMVVGLQTGAADDIQRFGSEEVKRSWLPRFASGEVQGCMDLTEPQAGSDLGGITTRASELPDGRIRIDGQKIYISNGGAEVHLVLARDADRPTAFRSCWWRATARMARAMAFASRASSTSSASTAPRPAKSSSTAPSACDSARRGRASGPCSS